MNVRLRVLSHDGVAELVRTSLSALGTFGADYVTWVPRGGAGPAGLIAQWLDIEMLPWDTAKLRGGRTILVEDLVVTGATLGRIRNELDRCASLTFALVETRGNPTYPPDVVAYKARSDEYVLLPWEIGDLFSEEFPFRVVSELDGVLRERSSGRPLLVTPRVPCVISQTSSLEADRRWAERHGLDVQLWLNADSLSEDDHVLGRPSLYFCEGIPRLLRNQDELDMFDVVMPWRAPGLDGRGYEFD